ncbi:MAG: uroporphyrinogen decarboxylase [Chloroflexi bacterium]|nr:uroporphyrinogen decarboxylase [Chloroflexota bacterium]
MTEMTQRERIEAALRGSATDRLPYSLWRHFHTQDRTPEGLASATLMFAFQYTPDIIKLTPCGLYGVEEWGTEIAYFDDPHQPPQRVKPVFEDSKGWESLRKLEPTSGSLGRELQAIHLTRAGLGPDWPLLMTIFSPLTLAFKLVGDRLLEDLRTAPHLVEAGLAVIAETMAAFAKLSLDAGADGIFFASQMASRSLLTPAAYTRFGEPFDLVILKAIAERSWLTVLHLHGHEVFFELANRYPVHAVNWHDRETAPALPAGLTRTNRALMAGLDLRLLETGTPAQVAEMVRESVTGTAGRRLILAPGCVIPTRTPAANLQAVVEVLRDDASRRA